MSEAKVSRMVNVVEASEQPAAKGPATATFGELREEVKGLGSLVLELSRQVAGLATQQGMTRLEVAQLSALVKGDHEPRLEQVEGEVLEVRGDVTKVKASLGAKAKVAALVGGKYAGVLTLAGLAGRAAAKQWPEFGELIEAGLSLLGL